MAFPPAFTNVWDNTFPPDTQQANQLGLDLRNFRTDVQQRHALLSGTLANQPTNLEAGFGGVGYGTPFFATDNGQVYQWNGATWNIVGSIAVASMPFGKLFGTSLKSIRNFGNSGGAGDIDVYTAPAGKRAFVISTQVNNTSGGTITWHYETKIGGTYYRILGQPSSSIAAQTGAFSVNQIYCIEAGETFSINVSGANFGYLLNIMEFDNTSPLKTVKITSATMVNGDNSFYTVPAGKIAVPILPSALGIWGSGNFNYENDSGATRTISVYAVPNGQAISNSYKIANALAVNNGNSSTFNAPLIMGAGDFVDFNVDSNAGPQIFDITLLEQ